MLMRLTILTTLIALFGLSFSAIVSARGVALGRAAATPSATGCFSQGIVCPASEARL